MLADLQHHCGGGLTKVAQPKRHRSLPVIHTDQAMHLRPSIPNGNYITPPRPADVTRFVPELARFARSTTRLHPRPTAPTAQQSSIGGPMLWPRAEPWPTCTGPYFHWDLDTLGSEPEDQHLHAAPNSRIPVLQLFASDAPTIRFPDDTDLLQLLWCPVIHAHLPGQPDAYARAITLLWRNSAALSAVAATPAPPVDFRARMHPSPVCTPSRGGARVSAGPPRRAVGSNRDDRRRRMGTRSELCRRLVGGTGLQGGGLAEVARHGSICHPVPGLRHPS